MIEYDWVFLSHADVPEDKPLVETLERIAKEEGVDLFVAEHMPRQGETVSNYLQESLNRSYCYLLLNTRRAAHRPFVHQEIGYAVSRRIPPFILCERGAKLTGLLYGYSVICFYRDRCEDAFHRVVLDIKSQREMLKRLRRTLRGTEGIEIGQLEELVDGMRHDSLIAVKVSFGLAKQVDREARTSEVADLLEEVLSHNRPVARILVGLADPKSLIVRVNCECDLAILGRLLRTLGSSDIGVFRRIWSCVDKAELKAKLDEVADVQKLGEFIMFLCGEARLSGPKGEQPVIQLLGESKLMSWDELKEKEGLIDVALLVQKLRIESDPEQLQSFSASMHLVSIPDCDRRVLNDALQRDG